MSNEKEMMSKSISAIVYLSFMINGKRVGLSLSGGGYRATSYHLGTLRKLKELGILDKVDVISTNSGGSITGALYGVHGDDYDEFEKVVLQGVQSSLMKGVVRSWEFVRSMLFILAALVLIVVVINTGHVWLSFILFGLLFWLVFKYQFILFPLSKLTERMYDRYFFNGKTLKDMSDKCLIAMNSTNMETGRPFTFSRNKMTDSTYEYPKDGGDSIDFDPSNFPIARAVAASTAVPFVFTPVEIGAEFYTEQKDVGRAKPRLADGGIYDNQGVHKLAQSSSSYSCDIIIVSDAGNMMPFKDTFPNVLALLIRTTDVFMNRVKNFQMIQLLFNNHLVGKREVAYQSLGWNIESSIWSFINRLKKGEMLADVWEHHGISSEQIENEAWDEIGEVLKKSINYDEIIKQAATKEERELARSIPVGISPLKKEGIDALIKHSYVLTEIQVKLYCPSLF